MGTRSIIAEPNGDGFRGRYCHWDGYPSWNGRQLVALVQRDGVETVRKTLLHDHGYWSSIKAGDMELSDMDQRGGFELVPGYGTTSASRAEEVPAWITEQDVGDHGCEWAYVLGDRELFVSELNWRGGPPKLVGTVPYDAPDALDRVTALG